MRFRSPLSLKIYENLEGRCPVVKVSCAACPVGVNYNGKLLSCQDYIKTYPLRAARLMGYGIIPDSGEDVARLKAYEAEEKIAASEAVTDMNVGRKEDGKDTNVPAKEEDMVNHPSHYTQGGIECIDALAAMITPYKDPNDAALSWQVVKYIWRHPFKHKPLEDLKKARFYLERLIRSYEEKETGDAV